MGKNFCFKCDESNDSESDFYMPGYTINYNPNDESAKPKEEEKAPLSKQFQEKYIQKSLSSDEIAKRCQVAYEGCGTTVSIEGHAIMKRT